MPSIRIDWPRIKELSANYNELALFVLPTSYRTMLLQVSQILEYEATFRINGYDYSDWDELQAVVGMGESGLMANETLADVIEAINNISVVNNVSSESTSEASATGGSGGCCGALDSFRIPDGFEDDPRFEEPTEHDDTPPVGDGDYMCDASNQVHDDMKTYVRIFAEVMVEESPYEEWFRRIVEVPEALPVVEYFWVAVTGFIGSRYGAFVDDCIDYLDSIENEIVCAIYTADSAEDSLGGVLNAIRDGDGSFVVKNWLEVLFGSGWSHNTIFNGTFVVSDENLGSVCVCDEPQESDWEVHPTWNVYGGSTTAIINSTSNDNVEMVGLVQPVGISGSFVAHLTGYDLAMAGYDAVSFTMTPDYSPVISGKRWRPQFGQTGNRFDIINTSATLDVPYRVLIHLNGFSYNPADYDITIGVSTRAQLYPAVWYSTTASGAISVTLDTQFTNFTVYPT